jgi:hypothetical protein
MVIQLLRHLKCINLTEPVHLHGLISGLDKDALCEKQNLHAIFSPLQSDDSKSFSSHYSFSS